MRNLILGLMLGVAAMAAVVWYFGDRGPRSQQVHDSLKDAAAQTEHFVKQQVTSLNLTTTNVQEELARTGRVVRKKAGEVGQAVADATADARTTAAIKAKMLGDPDLSAVSISVNTTAGLVTLSGTATSPEKIRKAMQLAWNTDGVRQVVSTIQVKQ